MTKRRGSKTSLPAVLLGIGIVSFMIWQYGSPIFDVIAHGTPLKETTIFILFTIGCALAPKFVHGRRIGGLKFPYDLVLYGGTIILWLAVLYYYIWLPYHDLFFIS